MLLDVLIEAHTLSQLPSSLQVGDMNFGVLLYKDHPLTGDMACNRFFLW